MAGQLYALQRDLDMITEKVQFLYTSFTTLDWMAQKMKKMEEELTCQGEQMRRIEVRLDNVESQMKIGFESSEKRFASLEQRFDIFERKFYCLEQRFDSLEQRFDILERKFDILERKFESFERTLALITKHLGIQ